MPPAIEPVTLVLAKKHLRIDYAEDDDLVALYLASARDWIEDYLGKALIAQQYTYTASDTPFLGATPYVALPFPLQINPLWFPWPNSLQQPFELPRAPIISIDSVGFGTWGQFDQVVPTTLYQTDPTLGRIRMLQGAVPGNSDHLIVNFTAGYSYDGTGIPRSIITALLMLLAHIYENRGDTAEDMPVAAMHLLTMHRRITFGG